MARIITPFFPNLYPYPVRAFDPIDLSPALYIRSDKGVKSNGAAQFTAANGESLSVADNANLSTGDIDFTIAGWVYFDSVISLSGIISKDNNSGNQREYDLRVSGGVPSFLCSSDGSSITIVSSSVTPSTATWYFVVAWHDSSANTINIQVDNATAVSQAHAGGVYDSTSKFVIGGRLEGTTDYHNGRIDSVGFWKRKLTADEKTWLYNSGTARKYAELGQAGTNGIDLKTNLKAYWNLDEKNLGRVDSHGSNHLTDNNTVTEAIGNVTGLAVEDNAVVNQWDDQSGNGNHLTQATVGRKPVFYKNIVNGKPVVRFDGSNDLLAKSISGFRSGDSAGTIIAVYKTSSNSSQYLFSSADESGNAYYGATLVIDANGKVATVQRNNDTQDYVFGGLGTGGSFHALTLSSNGSAYTMYLDGTLQSLTVSSGSNSGDWFADTSLRDNIAVGALKRDTNSGFMNGDIAEVLVYSRELSAGERQKVERYLANKYSITLS
jgi:hypothetical protein